MKIKIEADLATKNEKAAINTIVAALKQPPVLELLTAFGPGESFKMDNPTGVVNIMKQYPEPRLLSDIAIEGLMYEERDDVILAYKILESGYAGVLDNGSIVDRRVTPLARPLPANTLIGIPAPLALPPIPGPDFSGGGGQEY